MDIRRTRTCERCKAVVPLDKVRLFPRNRDANILVCEMCAVELKATQGLQRSPVSNRPSTTSAVIADFSTYACIRCSSSFRIDQFSGANTLHCPYCGKADRLTKQIPPQVRI